MQEADTDKRADFDTPQIRRVHLLIEGRVQGVFFRDSAHQEAQALRVSGWVRNLPDGRVEAVYEGEAEPVARLVSWTWRGPEGARVVDIDLREEAPLGERGFHIR